MPNTAAYLNVRVTADTDQGRRALMMFNRQLTATDRRSVTATTRTRALGGMTGRASKAFAGAARYAAGAAAAYLSIAQAKAAVTTTQDLAKTTAGLNRNLGLGVKEASRWGATAKARDVDAKALTLSFTTLSRRLVDTTHALREGGGAAESAMVPFTRLGLSQKDVVKGSKDLNTFLPKLADAFGEAEGGAKRQASAQQLLGRGYSTILPLFADGAKGLKEQQMWADKYGATLNNKTLKAQMDLVSAQRESKVAWLGLQMTFAKAVTPTLEKVNDQFQQIAAIMANDKLSNDERFRRIGKIIEGWADAALDAFTGILPEIIKKAGEAAPKIAGALWEGFKEAPIFGKVALLAWFLTRFGGAAAITAAGAGVGAIFGAGLATGIGETLALRALIIGDTLAAAAGPIAAVAGPVIGSALVLAIGAYAGWKSDLGPKIADTMKKQITAFDRVNFALENKGAGLRTFIGYAKEAGEAIDKHIVHEWLRAGDISTEEAARIIRALEDVNKAARRAARGEARRQGFDLAHQIGLDEKLVDQRMKKVFSVLDALPPKMRDVAIKSMLQFTANLERTGQLARGSTDKLVDNLIDKYGKLPPGVAKHARKVADTIDKESKRAQDAAAAHFSGLKVDSDRKLDDWQKKGTDAARGLRRGIEGNVDNLVVAVAGGMGKIAKLTNTALKAFGVKPVAFAIAEGVASAGGGGTGGGSHPGGGSSKLQRGGVLVPGRGSGDKVPAMLEPGEVVINRNAVAALGGAARANSINRMIPRFAKGGAVGGLDFALGPYTVPPIQYDEGHAGGNSHVHISGTTIPWVIAIGKQLQRMGNSVGEFGGPASAGFGPITTSRHAHYLHDHYSGYAIDVNNEVENQAWVASIARILGGSGIGGGAMAKKIKQVLLKGPAGPLRDLGQAALDKVRAAANKYIASKAPVEMTGATGYAPSGGGVLSKGELRKLMGSVGLPDIFGWIAEAESSRNPNAHNASGASGLWQIMMPLHAALVEKAGGNVFDPVTNAKVASMLSNGGTNLAPWAASQGVWGSHVGQAYQRGGVVSLRGGGAAKGRGKSLFGSIFADGDNPYYTGATAPSPQTLTGTGYHTATPSAAWTHGIPGPLPNNVRNHLAVLAAFQTALEEQVANAETMAAFPSSVLGADLSSGERAGQINLNETLLSNYQQQVRWIKRGLRTKNLKGKVRTRLNEALTTLQGVTGQGGLILGVKSKLDDLRHPAAVEVDTSGEDARKDMLIGLLTQGLGQANLRTAVSQAQYGVLSSGMSSGGIAPASADVKVYVWPDGKGASVSVNGQSFDTQVEQATRGMARRPLGAARGY